MNRIDDATVMRVVDGAEIRALQARYARCLDRGDWTGVRSCFTADATDDHGPYQGSVDHLVDGARELLADFWGAMHLLGQTTVEFHDDRAVAETYVISFHRRRALDGSGEEDTLTGLRYLDELVRYPDAGGAWRIAARTTVHEWNTTAPARPWLEASAFVAGRSDRDDPSYRLGLS